MKNQDFFVYTFYRFIKIDNKNNIKSKLDKYLIKKQLRGTILLADEGINASISGSHTELNNLIKFIKKILNIRKIIIKINKVNIFPFNRMKVRLKKEIVSLGILDLKFKKNKNKYVHPSKWDELISKKDIKLIDVRNTYEINIGKFKNSINPETNSFRDFPKKLSNLTFSKSDNIAIYCTGGIRCEKASVYMKKIGYKNVYQLEGGILNYLNYKKNNKKRNLWHGECFVFDNRVAVNKSLNKGKYVQCYGCRRPLSKKDVISKNYKKGIHCSYCYNSRSDRQILSSTTRQNQIDFALKNKIPNLFIKK